MEKIFTLSQFQNQYHLQLVSINSNISHSKIATLMYSPGRNSLNAKINVPPNPTTLPGSYLVQVTDNKDQSLVGIANFCEKLTVA